LVQPFDLSSSQDISVIFLYLEEAKKCFADVGKTKNLSNSSVKFEPKKGSPTDPIQHILNISKWKKNILIVRSCC
jgi:hypothetical protein